MFNYVRNLNSSTPPEVIKRPIGKTTEARFGELMHISGGALTSGKLSDAPLYLTLEAKAADDTKEEISCIRILPGTVLRAAVEFTSSAKNGDNCTFYVDDDGKCLTIAADGSDCEVIGNDTDFNALIIVN